jgi:hypothetical protein
VFRFEPSTFELGLTRLEAALGEYVRIYDPARTVVDLMRLRHRVGQPTALAPLQRYLRRRNSRSAELLERAAAHTSIFKTARRERRGTQELLSLYVVER